MRTIIGPAWMFYYSIKCDPLMVWETGIRIAVNRGSSALRDGSVSVLLHRVSLIMFF